MRKFAFQTRLNLLFAMLICAFSPRLKAADDPIDAIASGKIAFLGDSITQAGGYVTFASYYLQKQYPQKKFDIYGLGLASETLSGLSEPGHAGGKFPRPCLFERLGRLLERLKPETVIACYGINDGIYMPLDPERFTAFKNGVNKLIEQCKVGGVKRIYIVTPPIYDFDSKPGEFNYDSVMTEYAAWEMTLQIPGVKVIDLHTAMRAARATRKDVFSRDKIHPGDEGHLLMAKTILAALGVNPPDQTPDAVKADPLYKPVADQRNMRSSRWMRHIGYTRERSVAPEPLGNAEDEASSIQGRIDTLRRPK